MERAPRAPEALTIAIAIVPGVGSNHAHVGDAIAVLEQRTDALVCLHQLFSLHTVLDGHHGLHAFNLAASAILGSSSWHMHVASKRTAQRMGRPVPCILKAHA